MATIAGTIRAQALMTIKEWAERKVRSGFRPDGYLPAENDTELAYWQAGGFIYNGHPLMVTENGYLVGWARYVITRHSYGFLTYTVRQSSGNGWTVLLHEDDDGLDDSPDLPESALSTQNAVYIADYLSLL